MILTSTGNRKFHLAAEARELKTRERGIKRGAILPGIIEKLEERVAEASSSLLVALVFGWRALPAPPAAVPPLPAPAVKPRQLPTSSPPPARFRLVSHASRALPFCRCAAKTLGGDSARPRNLQVGAFLGGRPLTCFGERSSEIQHTGKIRRADVVLRHGDRKLEIQDQMPPTSWNENRLARATDAPNHALSSFLSSLARS